MDLFVNLQEVAVILLMQLLTACDTQRLKTYSEEAGGGDQLFIRVTRCSCWELGRRD